MESVLVMTTPPVDSSAVESFASAGIAREAENTPATSDPMVRRMRLSNSTNAFVAAIIAGECDRSNRTWRRLSRGGAMVHGGPASTGGRHARDLDHAPVRVPAFDRYADRVQPHRDRCAAPARL